MRASSVRIIALFGLLLALAVSAHWIGAGPDPAPTAHHATGRVATPVATPVGATGSAR
jgi:hypothetical protein